MRIRALERDDLDAVNEVTIRCNRDSGSWAPAGWVAPAGQWESEREAWAEILGAERIVGYVACDHEGHVVGVVAADIRDASRAIGFYEAHGWGRDGRTDWHRRLALPMIGMSKRVRR